MTEPSAPPYTPIVRTVAELRARVAGWRAAGERVALVPTMGALHAGHLSLVEMGRARAQRVVASVFVNPTQFAPSEDFDAYPRDEARDARLLASVDCDLMYAPSAAQMYPPGFSTAIEVAGVSAPLEGASRPHHFGGVATVVAKLLIQAGPDITIFGEKDYQQLLVIKRLALDLDLPVQILGAPIARAADGLALSSRNAYLSETERPIAGQLNVVLRRACDALINGDRVDHAEAAANTALLRAGFDRVDYFDVRGAQDLHRQGPGPIDGPSRVLVAAQLGRTRLIDNMAV